MDEHIENQLNEFNGEYIIISKTREDILNDVEFENEEERLICDSIIDNLESSVTKTIKDMKVAQIPFIGCLRINPIKRKLRDAKLHLSTIRKSITREQYKEHVRNYIIDLKQQQDKADKDKLTFFHIRRINKTKYELLFKKLGKAYAEMFIMSIYWLKEVPYSQEWEEQYQKLSNEGNTKENIINDNYTSEDIKNILASQTRYKFK